MKQFKRILSVTLACLLMLSALPISAFSAVAEGDSDVLQVGVPVTISGSREFTFTPTETAPYSFYSTGDVDTEGYLYNGEKELTYNDDFGEELNFRIFYILKEDVTYTFKANSLDEEETEEFTVQLYKHIVNEISPDDTFSASGETWFAYTPDATGVYQFYTDEDIAVDTEGYLYNLDFEELAYNSLDPGNEFKIRNVMLKGVTYYLMATPEDETDTGTYTGGFECVITNEYTVTADTTKTVSGYNLFYFTPTESGDYYFCSTGDIDTEGTLFAPNGELLAHNNDDIGVNFGIIHQLESGKTYTLFTEPHYEEQAEETYSVLVVKRVSATGVTVSPSSVNIYPGMTEYLSYTFTPHYAITEDVTWESGNTSIATVDDDGFVKGVAVGTTTVTATSENGLTDTVDITVSAIPAIGAGDTKNITITDDNRAEYFAFTPTEDGTYRIYSQSDIDPYLYIYDKKFNAIASDDDGGLGSDFDLTYNMTAGTTYILGISTVGSDTGTIKVILEKIETITAVEVISLPTNNTYVKGYHPGDVDYTGLKLKLTWSDGSTTEWNYGENFDLGYTTININEDIYSTGTVTVWVGNDLNTTYSANMIDNPVKSIEIIGDDVPALIENCNGYWDEYYDEDADEDKEFFYYEIDDYSDLGFKAKITYNDDTTITVDNISDDINGYYIERISAQYSSPWIVDGENNTITFRYLGATDTYNMVIEPNPVSSIEVIVKEDARLVENSGGYWSSYYDEDIEERVDFYYYNLWNYISFDLKITYTDGTTAIVKDAYYNSKYNGQYIDIFTNQRSNPWTVDGTENTVTFEYMNATDTYNVQIIKSPVEKIEIVDTNVTPLEENIHGCWNDEEEMDFFVYSPDFSEYGIKITYTDGTEKTFYNLMKPIDGYEVEYDYNQYDAPWTVGGTENTVIFEYLGAQTEYNVEIVENPVKSIEITKLPERIDYIYGDVKYGYMDYGEYYLKAYDITGMEITVNFKNGTSKNYKIDEDLLPSYTLDGYYVEISYDRFLTEEDIGELPVTLTYRGVTDEYNINIKKSNVSSVEIVKAPTKTQYLNNNFAPDYCGMEIKVTYTDGTFENVTVSEENVIREFDYDSVSYVATYVDINGERMYIDINYDGYGGYSVEVLFMGVIASADVINFEELWLYAEWIAVNSFSANGDLNITVTLEDGTTQTYNLTPVYSYDISGMFYEEGCLYVAETEYGFVGYKIFKGDSESDYCIDIFDGSSKFVVAGDINMDNKVDLNDVVTLAQYVAGWDITYNEAALDINGDGTVDLNDVVHLAQYVAGWDGVTLNAPLCKLSSAD